MWKESYRIGIERIDRQHMELFAMVDRLLKAIEQRAQVEEYRKALGFMKDYVVYHFQDEEEYQEAIGYPGREAHRHAHQEFTNTVLGYEARLEESGYSLPILKDLAGTLSAWLIYHVADADQKLVSGEGEAASAGSRTELESFSASTLEVLEKMTGLSGRELALSALAAQTPPKGEEAVAIGVGLVGEVTGRATFLYSKEFALGLLKALTFMEMDEVDELAQSALSEFSNIVSGNAASEISRGGLSCDITTPELLAEVEEAPGSQSCVELATDIGGLRVWVEAKA